MNKQWIENLKPGDKVIVRGRWRAEIAEVDRITPTGRIVINGTTFNPDGSERGGNSCYNRATIAEATPELIDKITRNNTVSRVKNKLHNINELTYEQAVEIEKILDK